MVKRYTTSFASAIPEGACYVKILFSLTGKNELGKEQNGKETL